MLPTSPEQASKVMEGFAQFTKSLSSFVDDQRGAPKIGSIPFFLSYFWQVQAPKDFPVYYTSMVTVLQDYNLWTPDETIGKNYVSFYYLNHELRDLFSQTQGRELTLWDVEHAFWFMTQPESPLMQEVVSSSQTIPNYDKKTMLDELPDSYIPPIVSILPRLAINDPELVRLSQKMGSSIEVVFEKRIDVLFKMLGYETEALGYGHGRVPDGIAICREYHYAIGYDAKVRQQPYAMGTEERAIREYISSLTDKLRRQGIGYIYFMIISSSFSGDHDDIIRSIKMNTEVREIILVEVGALVALLEAKLKNPSLTLGPHGIQPMLVNSGVLTEADVREFQGL